MSRPQSAAVQAALADIDQGMTAYAAAKKHSVQQSSLSRALKRIENNEKLLIKAMRDHIENMTDDKRIDFIGTLMDGYCASCGSKNLPCYCMRDE